MVGGKGGALGEDGKESGAGVGVWEVFLLGEEYCFDGVEQGFR